MTPTSSRRARGNTGRPSPPTRPIRSRTGSSRAAFPAGVDVQAPRGARRPRKGRHQRAYDLRLRRPLRLRQPRFQVLAEEGARLRGHPQGHRPVVRRLFLQYGPEDGGGHHPRDGGDIGITKPTGIDLPGEKSGLVPSTEWKKKTFGEKWYEGETVSVAIGQGAVWLTPIGLMQLASFVGNEGVTFKPQLVNRIVSPGRKGHEGVRARDDRQREAQQAEHHPRQGGDERRGERAGRHGLRERPPRKGQHKRKDGVRPVGHGRRGPRMVHRLCAQRRARPSPWAYWWSTAFTGPRQPPRSQRPSPRPCSKTSNGQGPEGNKRGTERQRK